MDSEDQILQPEELLEEIIKEILLAEQIKQMCESALKIFPSSV